MRLARIRLRVASALGYLAARIDRRVHCIVIRADEISPEECAACLRKGLEHSARLMAAEIEARYVDRMMHSLRPDLYRNDA